MHELVLVSALFAAATLYAAVGHGGASSYLAIMALAEIAPETMRPAALILNIFVSMIATIKYARGGYLPWTMLWPLVILSVPFAYVGGAMTLPSALYKPLLGVILCYCSVLIVWGLRRDGAESAVRAPSRFFLLGMGGGIGWLSGLTGIGGGIFLSPVLLLARAAPVKQISGLAAVFILVNSIAGLIGALNQPFSLPDLFPAWIAAVCVGGYLGAELGSRRLNQRAIRGLLALVLLVAGVKMIAV